MPALHFSLGMLIGPFLHCLLFLFGSLQVGSTMRIETHETIFLPDMSVVRITGSKLLPGCLPEAALATTSGTPFWCTGSGALPSHQHLRHDMPYSDNLDLAEPSHDLFYTIVCIETMRGSEPRSELLQDLLSMGFAVGVVRREQTMRPPMQWEPWLPTANPTQDMLDRIRSLAQVLRGTNWTSCGVAQTRSVTGRTAPLPNFFLSNLVRPRLQWILSNYYKKRRNRTGMSQGHKGGRTGK